MKFVFPILAILVCGAAAYFSFTQSEKFQDYQDARLLAISTNKTVTASADKADIEIENEQKLLEESKKNLDIVTASVQALESDATRLKNELAKVDADLAAQEVEKKQMASRKEAEVYIDTSSNFQPLSAQQLAQREPPV